MGAQRPINVLMNTMAQEKAMVIEVTPDGRSYYWLIGMLIGLPLGTLLVASLFSKDIDFWPLLTSLGGVLSIAPPLVLAIGLFFVLKGSIRVEAENLKIDAMITKKSFALQDIRWNAAIPLYKPENTTKRLTVRIFGVGLPGLKAGHFRLKDRSSALVLSVTDKMVFLPLQNGEGLIIDQINLDQLRAEGVAD